MSSPDALAAQAKAAARLSYVHGRVHAAVGGGHLGVEHPLARPDPATRHAAGDHLPARARAPHRQRQPHPVLLMPPHLRQPADRTRAGPRLLWAVTLISYGGRPSRPANDAVYCRASPLTTGECGLDPAATTLP